MKTVVSKEPVDPSRQGGGGGGRGSGPVIVPGNYTVRLAAGGKTMTQPLTVLIDPREAKDGVTIADLREQFQHNMRVRDMVSEVNQLADEYLGRRGEIEQLSAEELEQRLARDQVVLLDVRPEPEYRAGHIAGARSAPLEELPSAQGLRLQALQLLAFQLLALQWQAFR